MIFINFFLKKFAYFSISLYLYIESVILLIKCKMVISFVKDEEEKYRKLKIRLKIDLLIFVNFLYF